MHILQITHYSTCNCSLPLCQTANGSLQFCCKPVCYYCDINSFSLFCTWIQARESLIVVNKILQQIGCYISTPRVRLGLSGSIEKPHLILRLARVQIKSVEGVQGIRYRIYSQFNKIIQETNTGIQTEWLLVILFGILFAQVAGYTSIYIKCSCQQ